jgi:hypothetical protein
VGSKGKSRRALRRRLLLAAAGLTSGSAAFRESLAEHG